MSEHYDIDGNPMTLEDWAEKFEDFGYREIGRTVLHDGVLVSTVWLGLDHGFGGGLPLIFETMIFGCDDEDEYQERYATRRAAEEGHERAVDWAREAFPAT